MRILAILDDLFNVLLCVILLLCFSVLLTLRLPRLGKRELILVLFVRLFDLCLFGFVGFLFLLVSGKGCCLLLWHSLDFSLTFFFLFAFFFFFFFFFFCFFFAFCKIHFRQGKSSSACRLPSLRGVCSLANYSVAFEETQSNRVSDFRDFVFFVSKGNPFFLTFIILTNLQMFFIILLFLNHS